MHSYLKTVGFSQITRRSEIKEIIRDVIASYDERFAWKSSGRRICTVFQEIMAVTVESAFVVSTMRTVSFTWNIISHFQGNRNHIQGKSDC